MTTPPRHQIAVEEAVAFGVLTAVGAYAFVTAWSDYALFNEGNRVGPGLVPAVVGGLIALISAVLLVLTLTGRRARHDHGLAEVVRSATGTATESTAGSTTGDGAVQTAAEVTAEPAADDGDLDIFGRNAAQRMRQLQMVIVALVASVFLVPVLGLLGALGLFGGFASIVVERRPWLASLVITAASVAVIYVVFVVFLEVPLPTGVFGIGG